MMPGRLVRALLLVLLPVLAFLVLTFFAASPYVLERLLVSYMQEQGIQEPHLRVDSISHRGILVSEIRGRNLNLQIDRVSVRADWSSLLQGKVREITVTGLNWEVGYCRDGLDLGLPFAGNKRTGEVQVPVLPFEKLEIESSSVLLQHAGLGWRVPLSGVLTAQSPGSILADFETRLLGTVLHLQGEADLEAGTATVSADSDWPRQEGDGFPDRQVPVRAGLSLNWAGGLEDPGRGEVDFFAHLGGRQHSIAGKDFGFHKAGVQVQGAFEPGFSLERLQGDVFLENANFSRFMFSSINMLVQDEGILVLQADLEKPGKIKLDISGSHEDIFTLWSGDAVWSGQWDARLKGVVVPELAELLFPEEVQVKEVFPVDFSGRLEAEVSQEECGLNWRASLDSARAGAGPLRVQLPQQHADVRGVFLETFPRVSMRPGMTSVTLGRESRVGFASASLDHDGEVFEIPGLAAGGGDGWLSLELAQDSPPRMLLDAVLHKELDLLVSSVARVSFAAGGVQADLEISHGQPRGLVRVSLDRGVAKIADLDLELADISLDVPVSWHNPEHDRGRWSIGGIAYAGKELPGAAGTAAFMDNSLQAGGTWEFAPNAVLNLEVDLNASEQGLQGQAIAGTDWFELPSREYLEKFVPESGDIEFQGLARLNAKAYISSTGIEPYLEVELDDVDVASRDIGLEIRGLSGMLALDDLDPLQTARDQESFLHIHELQAGIISARDGLTSFRIRGNKVMLDKSSWTLQPQGRVSVYSSRWDTKAGEGLLDLYFEDVDLLEYVGRVSEGRIKGSGLFYGHVHVGLDARGISLGDGYVYSLPGTGRLGIKDQDLMDALLMYVRESLAGQEYLALLMDRLEEALRDFEYDFFTLNLVPSMDDVGARIEIRGEGVHGDPPQRVGSLVLNVSGVEETLNHALDLGITGEEAVMRALDEWLDF